MFISLTPVHRKIKAPIPRNYTIIGKLANILARTANSKEFIILQHTETKIFEFMGNRSQAWEFIHLKKEKCESSLLCGVKV